jgi:hypothetical protein
MMKPLSFAQKTVIAILGIIGLSGCVAPPQPSAVQAILPEASKPLNHSILKIDSGEGVSLSAGQRVAVTSWNGGLNRDTQIFCWEPQAGMSAATFKRFEYCLEYLNGLRSLDDYRTLVAQTYADQPDITLNNP